MRAVVKPKKLKGSIHAIPSKSDAHRCLICAALSDGPTELALESTSADIDATARCLTAMGAQVAWQEHAYCVRPVQGNADALLDCGESGSTLRFLLPVAAAVCRTARFVGHGRLPDRPISDLMAAMEAHGARFDAPKLPFAVTGGLTGGSFTLPGNVSSQYVSGILLALPLVGGGKIQLTSPLESAGYVNMTIDAMSRFGITVARGEDCFLVTPGQRYTSPGRVEISCDWSNAAFFLAAGALGEKVTIKGLDRFSPQGDRSITDILKSFGAWVSVSEFGVTARRETFRAADVDMSQIPDLLPVLAIVACAAPGTTRFTSAARLRIKESDRLTTVANMVKALGGHAEELPDGLLVRGGGLRGGRVDGANDHRIVMAAAVAAAICEEEVVIEGAEAVNKSYPAFFEDYNRLGGAADVF